jgi:hypothetical protein
MASNANSSGLSVLVYPLCLACRLGMLQQIKNSPGLVGAGLYSRRSEESESLIPSVGILFCFVRLSTWPKDRVGCYPFVRLNYGVVRSEGTVATSRHIPDRR